MAVAAPLLLFDGIDIPGLHTLEVYEGRGGYESLRKALAMSPRRCSPQLEASEIRGRGGAGFAMGKKISFLPKGAIDQLPRVQRRRVRAGDLQGPRTDRKVPPHADRGPRDRLLRRRREPLVRLHPRRVLLPGRHPRAGDRAKPAPPATSASASSAPDTRSRWSFTAAPAPTSAARRPRCSTRWRASAATRG